MFGQRAQNTIVVIRLHILPVRLAVNCTMITMFNTRPPFVIIRIIRHPNHMVPGPGIAPIIQARLTNKGAINVVVDCVLNIPISIFGIDIGCGVIKADDLNIPQAINCITGKIA